jgi:N-acylneuraminate cytidylyltransferase
MRAEGFRQARFRFFGRTVLHEMPAERHLEIDDPHDLDLADIRLRARDRARFAALLPDPVGALILDFDGVMTDNRVWLDQNGVESVACNRGDGFGLETLRNLGLPMTVISKEKNPVVAVRCRKLGIDCTHGVDDKLSLMHAWLEEREIDPRNAVYIGNDLNDVACMSNVGCAVAPSDAHADVLKIARIVLTHPGGHGAVRELCDLIMSAR